MTRVIRPRYHWPSIGLTALVCVLLALGVLLMISRLRSQNPLPQSIKKQINFSVYIPSSEVVLDDTSYKYDATAGVLSFTGHLTDGQTVTFAEQATPTAFTDIPNFYDKFLQTLYDYQSFDCLNGTVHLTHPKGAGQAAVMSAKGTLVFARVARDESATVWRRVFNRLTLYSF